ncbi:ATP-binding protein [Saccharothrix xinjiangensis]|uniref:ATP-binding protein n=1 Tax=Saccharothrix xinjiangensis TaxID=204798 RepID=A0ABV9YCD4_9PSEU
MSGDVTGAVVQVGVLHGGVHLHPSPPLATPRQLPAARAPFVGRVAELVELDRALTAPAGGSVTVVVSAIGGVGGVGKTWLALEWANRRLDRFPDGQLFVDLRGFSPASGPVAPADALRGFLTALGADPGRLPGDLDALAGLYRSLVAAKRVLVVLDNAADVEQVVPLLPGGASCAVLVTSRRRLTGLVVGHGARPLSLDVLTTDEAHALLVSALGAGRVAAEHRAARELIELCGGFPLVLALVVARARLRSSLREIVAELSEFGLDALDDDPTTSLPAVLSWSLRHLTDEQRTVFALLGAAPGPDIGLPAAACLAGLAPARTRKALQALEDASLVDHRADNRYAMHDLVRACAGTVPEPGRQAALERVVDFYLHTAHAADRLLDPHTDPIPPDPPSPGVLPRPPADQPAAMAWLEAEHTNLIAAQRTAAAHHRHRAAWHLAWNLTTFHWRRGHLHDDLAVWRVALDAAEHLSDPAISIRTLRSLGSAHSWLEHHEEAVEHLCRALALAEHHHDIPQQAVTHNELVHAWERRGDDHKALEHARRTLELHRALGNPVREAMALNAVGWCAARTGDHDTAREHCRAALALHRRHHEPGGEADTLNSLGWIDHHTGRHHRAIRHYRQAIALYRALGHTYYLADTLDALGRAHAALARRDPARTAWREALGLYREQGRGADVERVQRQLDDLDANPTNVNS